MTWLLAVRGLHRGMCGGRVRFFKEFDNFAGEPLPACSVAEYREYMKRSMDFIGARNERIAHCAA